MGGGKRPLDPSMLSPTLGENSWKMIARASEEGIAKDIWKVGDEIDIVLTGDYKGSITAQIAGFGHDDLVEGGKAGITFLSKQVLSGGMMSDAKSTTITGWEVTLMRSQVMPKIRASLPTDLQKCIKTVLKSSSKGTVSDGGNFVTEDDVFIPSLSEVLSSDSIDQKGPSNFPVYDYAKHAKKDGNKYDVFRSDGDIQKTSQVGSGAVDWWTRSAVYYGTNCFCMITGGAKFDAKQHYNSSNVCFGFCI